MSTHVPSRSLSRRPSPGAGWPAREASRLRRVAAVAGLALAMTATAGASGGGAQQPLPQKPVPRPGQVPAFKAGVDVVSLNVTVTDPGGRYVTDLQSPDFSVYEDGVKQDLAFFNHTNLPIALSLLMDTSASMEEKLATAQEAAVGFARRMRPEDLAELIDFDSRVEVTQAFTSNTASLEQAIRKTTAGGSTSLYNAIYISLKELKKIRARSPEDVHRQAIVVLSDGEDTSSLVSFEQVLELAKRSETAIYTIGLRSRELLSAKGFNEAEYVLRELAQQTGGRAFFPNQVEDLAGVYGQISDELSSQYMIGYTSKNQMRDGNWRRIVVRVNRPSTIVRTKQGYYAPSTHDAGS